jgi:hypothetical protein
LSKYGEDTAFFSTNDYHAEALIRQIAFGGGLMVEADIPSALVGYPGAFGLDLNPLIGQWEKILMVVEEAAVRAGASGRLGLWPFPPGFSLTSGLVEYGIRVTDGKVDKSNLASILECLGGYTPGAFWNGSVLSDPVSDTPLGNFILVYQDTYILGRGIIRTTELEIPLKYYTVSPEE